VQEVAKSVNNISLGDVTVIDGGDGKAIAGAAMSRARTLSESLATLESILGVDFRELTRGIAANIVKPTNGHDPSRKPPEPALARG